MANQPPTATEEAVAEEEPSGPLKYKTWSLKVSVHCEGCKRKVKKILLGIEGVYTVDVDTKLHKATVTANVDPEVLIRKLEKSGKHAELWPEKADQKESKRSKKKKNKQNDQGNPESNDNNDDSAAAEPDKPDPNKGEATGPPPSKVVEVVNSGKPGGNVQFKEIRIDPNNQPAGDNNPHAPENKPPEGAANNAGGGGGGGKKKKRKGKGGGGANGNGNGGEPPSNGNGEGNDGPPCTQPAPQGQGPPPPPGYRSPPRNYPVYDHPPPYYAPPPQAGMPVYAVSYNTAYPSSSYTASYYANPPHSYAYVHQGGSDSAEGGPSDTFEMFSDENPNACAVM